MPGVPCAAGDRPVRSFIAIEIEPPARAAVEAYLETLRPTFACVAWTRPESLHLTLKFLGGVLPARLAALADRLQVIAAGQAPFALTVAGVGAFPSIERARVLWVGVAAPELAALAAAVDGAAVVEGVPGARRPFHPHVTLGRVRQRSDRRAGSRRAGAPGRPAHEAGLGRARFAADAVRQFGTSIARALVLFRSDLGPGGARHTALGRLIFGGVS